MTEGARGQGEVVRSSWKKKKENNGLAHTAKRARWGTSVHWPFKPSFSTNPHCVVMLLLTQQFNYKTPAYPSHFLPFSPSLHLLLPSYRDKRAASNDGCADKGAVQRTKTIKSASFVLWHVWGGRSTASKANIVDFFPTPWQFFASSAPSLYSSSLQ